MAIVIATILTVATISASNTGGTDEGGDDDDDDGGNGYEVRVSIGNKFEMVVALLDNGGLAVPIVSFK